MVPAVPAVWPSDWNQPSAAIVQAVEEASREFSVPTELLYGLIRKESNFDPRLRGKKHGLNNATFKASYERYRDKPIPGSSITWGQMFAPEDWRPHGLCQLLPYHLVNKRIGEDTVPAIKAGAPLSALYDVRTNVRAAAQYLAQLYRKYGEWNKSLQIYNGSSVYVRMVAAHINDLKAARGVA